ncbi:DUF222 domain-containing protein [Gordonia sp. NPDC003504]
MTSGELDITIDLLSELDYTNGSLTREDAKYALHAILLIRNLVDHHASILVGQCDHLGVAENEGRKLQELLHEWGVAPASASRMIRLGTTPDIERVHRHTSLGTLSAEHADAIVRGLAHIEKRSGQPVTAEERDAHSIALLGHATAGFTPAEIRNYAKSRGNQQADDTDGLPAGEDRSINTLDFHDSDDGRLTVTGDLHAVLGEKLRTAIEVLSAPRPQPDGSRDPRTAGQMRADALENILDTAARAARGEHRDDDGPRMPTELINLTIPTGTPSMASLQFMGSVTEATARKLCCDATVGVMIVSKDEVPLSLGRTIRLFNRAQRRALTHRDKGCIKCGAPASRCQAHHIVHWIDGGETCLENGALLCTACHDDVHHNGWDVVMGADHHPWLIPPESVDPQRRWLRSYHRRTMTLDGLPGAA